MSVCPLSTLQTQLFGSLAIKEKTHIFYYALILTHMHSSWWQKKKNKLRIWIPIENTSSKHLQSTLSHPLSLACYHLVAQAGILGREGQRFESLRKLIRPPYKFMVAPGPALGSREVNPDSSSPQGTKC